MSPAVNFVSRARGEHPVMSDQCPQRLPVHAGELLALLGLSLAECRPGDRLDGLARVSALLNLAKCQSNFWQISLISRHGLTLWSKFSLQNWWQQLLWSVA